MDAVEFKSIDQRPTILWIGCSDARVAETNVIPGTEIFVQRNVANQFSASDPNTAACVAFVLNLPSVKEIIVVGHTHCGGVKACFDTAKGDPPGLHPHLLKWLEPLQRLANSLVTPGTPLQTVIKANVVQQMANVRAFLTTLPLEGRQIAVKGAIYDIENERLDYV
ncbi:hypothetical protein D9613_004756 [Agrocybe pediades]|uniref:Carbonic anhydrase n=1 Tax=Agrocybe pediades TaxID=84607 RepID=A0A8H4QYE6_9AGAR|nr:hypothetical protein D9613_004756 [Agrocybe pediades]KAF9551895.1 carbonic anhydrase [Agrocybe pediades]